MGRRTSTRRLARRRAPANSRTLWSFVSVRRITSISNVRPRRGDNKGGSFALPPFCEALGPAIEPARFRPCDAPTRLGNPKRNRRIGKDLVLLRARFGFV